MNKFKFNQAPICSYDIPKPLVLSLCLLCFLLIILARTPLSADQTLQLNSDKQLEYANFLFEKKSYADAAAEFTRFVYFFPGDEHAGEAQLKIGLSYFYQRDFENALKQFKMTLDQYGPTDSGIQSGLYISRCYFALNDHQAAVNNIHALAKLTDDSNLHNKLNYFLGWLYIESGNFQDAQLAFADIQQANQAEYPAESIIQETEKYHLLSYKNPTVSGFLSIVPGGGYLYCKRYNDAMISFLINGAMIGAAYESFDHHLNVLGAIIAAVEVGFYGGNIYGGVSSAHKYNQALTRKFIDHLKNQFNVDLMAAVDSDGVSFKIQRRFK